MNIYFSGSINGADLAKENYPGIITQLQKYGTVLTEHIGKLAQGMNVNVGNTPQEVFDADVSFIDQSDIVIAEVSAPSLGVGREIAYAQYVRKIPIYCLHLEDARVSWMLKGNKYVQCISYQTIEELPQILEEIFKE